MFKVIKTFLIILLISIVLTALMFGFLILVFTLTAFDADPEINVIAKAFYLMNNLPPWYVFDMVLAGTALVALIVLYYVRHWKLKELVNLVVWLIVFSLLLNVGLNVNRKKQAEVNLQERKAQQEIVDNIYKIDRLEAQFIKLSSSEPKYRGKIYLTGEIAGEYEYLLTQYANEVEAKVIRQTINLSEENKYIPIDLSVANLARAWISKRMNRVNIQATFPLKITLDVKLKLIRDTKGALVKKANYQKRSFVSDEIRVNVDHGELSFSKNK